MPSDSTTRRSILDILLGLGLLSTLAGLAAPVLAYLMPLKGRALSGNTFEDKNGNPIPADALAENSGAVGRLGGRPLLVVRKNGQILGFSAVCTHLGCIVRWNPERGRIECPCHGGRFNLRGEVVGGPPPEGLQPVPLQARGQRIVRG